MPTAGQRIRALDFEGFGEAYDTTDINTTSTSYTFGTAGQELGAEFIAPTSGVVIVQVSAVANNSSAGANIFLTPEVREGTATSGSAVTTEHDDNSARFVGGTNPSGGAGRAVPVTGLTAGSTYTAWCKHRVSSGTGTWNSRSVTVWPVA